MIITFSNKRSPNFSSKTTSHGSSHIFIKRDKEKFTQIGRNHTLEESIEKDKEILNFLEKNDLSFIVYDYKDLDKFVDEIINSINI